MDEIAATIAGLPLHVDTDLLVIGAGPAGACLACFIAHHGLLPRARCIFQFLTAERLHSIMLASTLGTAGSPRARITNMAALECLRDIGLEEKCKKLAVKGDSMQHTRWCKSMAGEEFARIYSWGNDPACCE
jgi:2-polyprenyl-6-methoxyphenol hydroxylase-like FAD-dependent oxidoreductase